MWKRTKNSGPSASRITAIRRRSKTPGVMITQYVVNMPEGKSTPDFQYKPESVTVKEGKLAVFKAVVNGDPKPDVSWRRAKGTVSDKEKFQSKYDESTGEYILEVHKVSGAETDTYKCIAVNEYGKAVCTATLTVTDGSTNPSDFRKLLRKSKVDVEADVENDKRFWDAMLNANRRDYERICAEFGVKDLDGILKKLEEKKREQAKNKSKDGVIPYDEDGTDKHSLKSIGSRKGLMQNGAGLNQVDVEEFNLLNTGLNQLNEEEKLILAEFKLSNVDFVIKIQEVKAQEREDALFECVLTHPLPRITWTGKGNVIEDGEKYRITMSDHKLIHRLLIKDCMQLDKGIYSAVAGIKSSSAWLVVEADSDPASAGKKMACKTTVAGGAGIDLEKVAREQQIKNREEMEKILASVKAKHEEGKLRNEKTFTPGGRDGDIRAVTEPVCNVDFVIKIQEVKAQEREDALFECVLTHPLPRITWMGKGSVIEDGEKYSITMSDHKLIHRLLIKDCMQLDNGIYSAVAGITSSSAWLVVEADSDPASAGKMIARKTTVAGGAGIDLEKVAREQQIKNREEMEKILASVKAKHEEGKLREEKTFTPSGRDGDISAATGPVSNVDFVIKIQEVKAQEREDALFECVLTHPLPRITWMGKGSVIEDGEKYSITMSDHKLIHRLLIKDCMQLDKGIYSAVAGITSSSAWLVVEADSDPASAGKMIARKTTVAGGAGIDLEKVAREQQIKKREEMEKILASVKAKHEEGKLREEKTLTPGGRDGDISAVTEPGKSSGAVKDKHNATKASALSELTGSKGEAMTKNSKKDGTGTILDASGCETKAEVQLKVDDHMNNKHTRPGQADIDKVTESRGRSVDEAINHIATGHNEVTNSDGNKDSTGSVRCQKHKRKVHWKKHPSGKMEEDPNELASEDEASDSDEYEDSSGQVKRSSSSNQSQQQQKAVNGAGPMDHNECDETEDAPGSPTRSRRKRQGPLIEDMMFDPVVQFICGLSDINAIINQAAELTCKLSSEDCEGAWFRDGKKISPDDNFTITKEGAIHKLVIIRCKEEHSGKYRFEADARKTEAMVHVKDPPRFDPKDLSAFTEPVTVKVGHNAIFKLHFVGFEPIKIQWYKEGEELQDDTNTRIEKSGSHSRLLLSRCQRKDTGEIKIKLKNEHGFTEAISQLIVLDKPTSPLGPAEVTVSSATCIEFRWRPPKDDGGSPVINYIMERQQVGRNTWKKIGEIPGVPSYRDTDVDHGRKYCYRIRAVTAEGTSEVMETDDMQAGTLAFPGPPAPPKVVSAFDDCINISWDSPSNRGGSRILGYILERRKKGSNLWTVVNAMDELIKEKKYAVKDIVAGMEYEFRVTAINLSGVGEFSSPSEFVFARDPKQPPGKVTSLKVTETSYSHLVLTWTKPEDKPGVQDEARGYFVEIRQADCIEWSRCNTTPILTTSYSVKGLKSMDMYWVKVIATNDGGESAPEELANYVLAMPSPVRPKFTNHKMKSFMVVKAGNSVRITVNFEASPRPHIMWLKDNSPVTKRVTISNSDGSSQLLIPSSERSDSGIYSILVKNLAGQETFSIEARVTDDPKPPGPIELEENVPGTVTVIWEPSPDEKRDDRLHYTVSKLDSTKRTWTTVADRLFNNKFTVCNIMHGREYNFRVYAKNDMGISAPSESPTWGVEKKKEKFVVSALTGKDCDLRCAPTFIVPLKLHNAPKGYECYMSCAVKGNPKPRVTWYRNHISLNTNTNYYISNTCGVCSMLILRVGPRDMGEYTITAENALGRAECSTVLSIRE